MNNREFHSLFYDKIGYDTENKKFLVRVYPSLIRVFTNNSRPRWVDVIEDMIGRKQSGYYSSIRRCLKEIEVCTFDRNLGYFVKGKNWDRFVSDEDWNWFVCRTGSGERSYIKNKF
jgi:hypothetical protein